MYSIGTRILKGRTKEFESEFLDIQLVIILSISFQMVLNYGTLLKGTQTLSIILPLDIKKLRLEHKHLLIVSDIIDRRRMAKKNKVASVVIIMVIVVV